MAFNWQRTIRYGELITDEAIAEIQSAAQSVINRHCPSYNSAERSGHCNSDCSSNNGSGYGSTCANKSSNYSAVKNSQDSSFNTHCGANYSTHNSSVTNQCLSNKSVNCSGLYIP